MIVTKVTDKYIFLKEPATEMTFVYARGKTFRNPGNTSVVSAVVMIYDGKARNLFVLDEFYKFFKGVVTVFTKQIAGSEVVKTALMPLNFFLRVNVHAASVPPSMATKAYSVSSILTYLNELVTVDAEAVTQLVGQRVPCSRHMGEHPYIQTVLNNGNYKVGILGILCGMAESLYGYKIYAQFDASNKVIGFGAHPV